MADKQHVEWLLEGVSSWNRRRQSFYFRPDFRGADLRSFAEQMENGIVDSEDSFLLTEDGNRLALEQGGRLKLEAATGAEGIETPSVVLNALKGVDFSDADLRGADLSHLDLSGANFERADLGSDLLTFDGTSVTFDGTDVTFDGTGGPRSDLSGSLLLAANLKAANLIGTEGKGGFGTAFSGAFARSTGLTQEQLNTAIGDIRTLLPSGYVMPDHWETESDWLLKAGRWNDGGVWEDDAVWSDEAPESASHSANDRLSPKEALKHSLERLDFDLGEPLSSAAPMGHNNPPPDGEEIPPFSREEWLDLRRDVRTLIEQTSIESPETDLIAENGSRLREFGQKLWGWIRWVISQGSGAIIGTLAVAGGATLLANMNRIYDGIAASLQYLLQWLAGG